MYDQSLVSVIIPTYNRSFLLRKSVISLLSQTYTNLEIIIVDDGSTDDTEKVVKSFNEDRIVFIKLEKNNGANYARNIGLKKANGKYVSFLDSDDEFEEKKIEMEFHKIRECESTGLVYSWFHRCFKDNSISIKILDKPEYKGKIFSKLLYQNILGNPSPLIKKECFENVGLFDENLKSCQDWEMWIRISQYYKIDFVNIPLVIVNIHGEQISTKVGQKIQSMNYIFEKYKNFMNNKTSLSSYFRKIGNFYSISGQRGKSSVCYRKAILLNPFDIYNYIHLFVLTFSLRLHQKLVKKFSLFRIGNIYLYF